MAVSEFFYRRRIEMSRRRRMAGDWEVDERCN
jgi:hypothetical protein